MGYCINELQAYRQEAIHAARGLRYGDNVISAINQAKSISEISKIMTTARHKACDAEIGMSVEEYDRLIDKTRP